MANALKVASIIAREAVMILENELPMKDAVYDGYEEEYSKNVNGYKIGDTLTVRRPVKFAINSGPTAVIQDSVEGSVQIVVNQQKNITMDFTSVDLSLFIDKPEVMSERIIKPAMVDLANQVDRDVNGLFTDVANWVGTPGNTISSFTGFTAGTQRLNERSAPMDKRTAVLSPADAAALKATGIVGPASIFAPSLVNETFRRGQLPDVDNCKTFMSQNAPILTTGSRTNGALNGGTLSTTWAASKDTDTQTFTMNGVGANATVSAGEVFTLANVFEVNWIGKQTLSFLKQFAVVSAATADGSGNLTVTARPALIPSGPFQNASAIPASNAAVTWKGSASTNYQQNVMFHKNAFALVIVPMIEPPAAPWSSRMSHKGVSVRVWPVSDGVNDLHYWRLDILYGVKTIDPRIAVRVNGV